jgi:uncharacterized protein YjiS (DUF1127 family)
MQFDNQLSGNRSPLAFARNRLVSNRLVSNRLATVRRGASRYSIYATTSIGGSARLASLRNDTPWRSAFAVMSELMVKAFGNSAACGEVALLNFLLTVVSWTIRQVLAGCAVLGEAIYPGIVKLGEQINRRHERRRWLATAELRTLDDRTLRDIGISRCEIEYLARGRDPCE